ncbi:hypothetical protein [Melghiribacillus thermohalophilus]|nr:hypothetical protein [Melghiribacillus thermohalophilus]
MQQQQTTQNQNMQMPPTMVSSKDQMYLTDMLTWNLTASKKAHFFARQCQNQDVKTALEDAGRMHQRHYEKILQYLNRNPNPAQPS